jgi:hypothetical protein
VTKGLENLPIGVKEPSEAVRASRELAAKKRSDVISIAMSPVVEKGLEPKSQHLTFLPPGTIQYAGDE